MPKLQEHKAVKIGDKTYTKWVINLPNDMVKLANFKKGDSINVKAYPGKMVLTLEKRFLKGKSIINSLKIK